MDLHLSFEHWPWLEQAVAVVVAALSSGSGSGFEPPLVVACRGTSVIAESRVHLLRIDD